MKPTPSELMEWLRAKLKEAEVALKFREDSERVWADGTDVSWAAATDMHPSTRGKYLTRRQRIEVSDRHGRIAVKCRREVEMLRAVIDALSAQPGLLTREEHLARQNQFRGVPGQDGD